MKWRPSLEIVVLATVLALAASPSGADEQGDELKEIRDAIERSRSRLGDYDREHRGLLETLEALDQSTAALDAEWRRQQEAVARALSELASVDAELLPAEARLATTKRALRARALALYRNGELGPMQVLFAATALREVIGRAEALRILLDHDTRLMSRFKSENAVLRALRAKSVDAAKRREEALLAVDRRRSQLTSERGTKQSVLDAVRKDRAQERAALAELESAARALEETLDRLDRSSRRNPVPGADFASLRGRLPAPVDAPIARRFGRSVDDEFHTQLFHKGVDFDAKRGTLVSAVAPGRVRFAGWFRGYGRMVIVDHGDRFFTVSGHLDTLSVAVGDALATGDPIGSVGDSGSLVGPRLYFEVRRGDEAQDPAEWLAR